MNRWLVTVLKIGVSISILYLLFTNIDVARFWDTVSSVNPGVVALIVLLVIFIQSLSTYRWSILLRKDMEVPYLKLLSIYFIGFFFNNFFPTLVGGDLIKGYYLYRASGRGDVSIASIFMDRYSGFTALMIITAFALVVGYPLIKDTELPLFFLILLGGYLVMSLVLWVDSLHSWAVNILTRIKFYRINEKIETFYNILMGYKRFHNILIKALVCSFVVQGGMIVGYYILSKGLGMGVSIGYFFLFIPLATAAAMLPISLSGLGIREGAFVFLFTKAGATKEDALSLSLLFFMIMALTSIIGGIEYIRTTSRGQTHPQEEEIESFRF